MTCNLKPLAIPLLLVAGMLASQPASGQTYTNPSATSRYAPANAAAPNATQPQGATGPARPTYSTAPTVQTQGQTTPGQNPGTVRPAAMQGTIRQPQGVAPAGGAPAALPLGQQPLPEPQMPAGFPLEPALEAHVDQILQYWEKRSDQIKTYRCEFQRWDYDPVFGPRSDPSTFAKGVIQYASPDKGLFRVDSISKFTAAAKPGEQGTWAEQKDTHGEHWVSDGQRVFEFDNRAKRLIERILPAEMRGKAIADGPLPFLFGAKAATIKARYWIRSIQPPEGTKGEYWLEAHPKSRSDAANFKMVLVVLDEADYLPKMLQVFSPNFNAQTNPAKTAYKFDKREVNKVDLLGGLAHLNPFFRDFYEPKLPAGWKKEIENLSQAPPGPPASNQAVRPAAGEPR